jgi:hypothetical protein
MGQLGVSLTKLSRRTMWPARAASLPAAGARRRRDRPFVKAICADPKPFRGAPGPVLPLFPSQKGSFVKGNRVPRLASNPSNIFRRKDPTSGNSLAERASSASGRDALDIVSKPQDHSRPYPSSAGLCPSCFVSGRPTRRARRRRVAPIGDVSCLGAAAAGTRPTTVAVGRRVPVTNARSLSQRHCDSTDDLQKPVVVFVDS